MVHELYEVFMVSGGTLEPDEPGDSGVRLAQNGDLPITHIAVSSR